MTGRPLCECGCGEPVAIAQAGPRYGKPNRFVHGHNMGRRENSPAWKGGRRIGGDGYVYLYRPKHPRAGTNGYVREHIVIVERAMGRPLPEGAEVHHMNEIRHDNRPENLVVCPDTAYHKLLHQRMRARDACGHPDWRICTFCQEYDDPERMVVLRTVTRAYHRECDLAAQRERRKAAAS